MADRGALPLIRPLLSRTCVFFCFSKQHVRRFQNPRFSISDSHQLCLSSSRSTLASVNRRRFSYKIFAAADDRKRYRVPERGKRGTKRRELWEELFEDNVEDDDVDDTGGGGGGGSGKSDLWKILEEIVDNVWILKSFRSYGYLLPFIILSLFFNTGPKAFLLSLGVAIGPSLLFLAFQKLVGWDQRKKTSMGNQFGIDEKEEEVGRMRSRSRYNPSSVRDNVNGRGINRGPVGMASEYGGWDDLDGLGTIPEQPMFEPKKKPLKKTKRVRREAATEPLLLRLLVSLFPFLSS